MERLHAKIHGRVQGVGFRANTKREAQRLNVNGWVRNNPDGTVEVVAEGARDQLETLAAFLKSGPSVASVDDIDVDWRDATHEFDQFTTH